MQTITRSSCLLALACIAGLLADPVWAQTGATNNTSSSTTRIAEGTRLKNVEAPVLGVSGPGPEFAEFHLTAIARFFAVSPAVAGGKDVKGRWKITHTCFGIGGQDQNTVNVKIKNGIGLHSRTMDSRGDCNFAALASSFSGNSIFPIPGQLELLVATTPVYPGSGCRPDTNVLCLGDEGRFKVELDWRDGPGRLQPAVAFPDGVDSGLFYFFDAENWEMLIKVLDGCSVNDHFWVFAAATTDVEYQLTVTDTVSGFSKEYSNELGGPSPAITDTTAFMTCEAERHGGR